VPGTKPFVDSVEFRALPGPASRVQVQMKTATVVAGQSLHIDAIPFSKANDRTLDRLQWRSGDPRIATVDQDGVITGVAPGSAQVTAVAGSAQGTIALRVVAGNISRLSITPAKASVRQGDVVHFGVDARDGAGRAITGLTPTWSFSPGDGQLDADGHFVAYRQ